jgi:hypothetical protein
MVLKSFPAVLPQGLKCLRENYTSYL